MTRDIRDRYRKIDRDRDEDRQRNPGVDIGERQRERYGHTKRKRDEQGADTRKKDCVRCRDRGKEITVAGSGPPLTCTETSV